MRFAPLLLFASLVSLQAGTLEDVLARIQEKRAALDFRASGRLVHARGAEQRRSWQISLKGHSFGDLQRLFCEVTEPAAARVRVLIESRAAGRMTVRTGHPGEAAAQELPFEKWSGALLDTDFSYEDLLESHFSWKRQTLVEEAKYGARDCYVIRSEPGPGERSHYASVTTWLDRSIYFPVRMEKVLKGNAGSKEFLSYGLRQVRGMWAASQIEARTKGRPGSTFLIINRGSADAHLRVADFEPALLVRP